MKSWHGVDYTETVHTGYPDMFDLHKDFFPLKSSKKYKATNDIFPCPSHDVNSEFLQKSDFCFLRHNIILNILVQVVSKNLQSY